PHQPTRAPWLNEQESHFHHARRFQSSPLSYFKWSKGENPHDHGGGGSGAGGGGGIGGINYVRTTSTGSLSGPPTPTNGHGGPNTPLVVPQPIKPPSRAGTKSYQCKICDQ
ncbi:unnamed protein product, partial [Candidula unifasciata]